MHEKLPLTHSFAIQCLHSSLPQYFWGDPASTATNSKDQLCCNCMKKECCNCNHSKWYQRMCCWSIQRMLKPFSSYLLWHYPWHCPWAPCEELAGAIEAILGFLAFLEAVCQTYPSDCATENSNRLDMCFKEKLEMRRSVEADAALCIKICNFVRFEFHMTVDPHSDLNRRELSLLLPFPTSPGLYTAVILSLFTIQILADLRPQFIQGPVFITRLYPLVWSLNQSSPP